MTARASGFLCPTSGEFGLRGNNGRIRDEEVVEHAERNRWHGKEIHRRNRFPMVSKEGQPALGPVRISRRSSHPTGDGSLGKFNSEHAEFPVDPRRSLGWVLNDHTEDQFPNLLRRGTASKPTRPAERLPRRAYRRGRDSGENVDASARRVVDAKRDSREGDFAAREKSGPAFRSRARRIETWSGFITGRW